MASFGPRQKVGSRTIKRSSGRQRPHSARRRLHVEPLEPRWFLSVSADVFDLNAVGPVMPALQDDAAHLSAITLHSGDVQYVPGELRIEYKYGLSEAEREAVRSLIGAELKEENVWWDCCTEISPGVVGATMVPHEYEIVTLPPGLEPREAARRLEGNPSVQSVGPNWSIDVNIIETSSLIAPPAKDAPPASDSGLPLVSVDIPYVPGEILVQYQLGVSESEREAVRNLIGATLKDSIDTPERQAVGYGVLELVTLSADGDVPRAIELLKGNQAVKHAEQNRIFSMFNSPAIVHPHPLIPPPGDVTPPVADPVPAQTDPPPVQTDPPPSSVTEPLPPPAEVIPLPKGTPSSRIPGEIELPGGSRYVSGQLVIRYRAGVSEAEREAIRSLIGAVVKERVDSNAIEYGEQGVLELVTLPASTDVLEAARTIQASPAVRYAEPNWTCRITSLPLEDAPAPAPAGNVAPTLTIETPQDVYLPAQQTWIEVTVADPGETGPHQVLIDWGDGSPVEVAGDRRDVEVGRETLYLQHAYGRAGNYTIRFTAIDSEGLSSTAEKHLEVSQLFVLDPSWNPGHPSLYVGGTPEADNITLEQLADGRVAVTMYPGAEPVVVSLLSDANIKIYLGDGADTLTFRGDFTRRVIVDAGAGDDRIDGSSLSSKELSWGTCGWANVIKLGEGNDVYYAGPSYEFIDGGPGLDIVYGADANDFLLDVEGHDAVLNGPGSIGSNAEAAYYAYNILVGNSESDQPTGGTGLEALKGAADENTPVPGSVAPATDSQGLNEVRVAQSEGSRVNTSVVLKKGSTVLDNEAADRIFGADESDWLLKFETAHLSASWDAGLEDAAPFHPTVRNAE